MCAFVSNSTTRTGIHNHFCKEKNITDLQNKFVAQNNLSFVIGNLVGIGISLMFEFTTYFVFTTIATLSAFHTISSLRSNGQVYLLDFNFIRAYYLCKEIIENKTVIDPLSVNKKESSWFLKIKYIHFCNSPFESIFNMEKRIDYMDKLFNIFHEHKFFTYVKACYSAFKMKVKYHIYTFLRVDAENNDIFLAFLFTIKLHLELNCPVIGKNDDTNDKIINNIQDNLIYMDTMDKKDIFHQMREKGYDMNFNLLEEKYIRYQILTR
jgi:hypothetical protein